MHKYAMCHKVGNAKKKKIQTKNAKIKDENLIIPVVIIPSNDIDCVTMDAEREKDWSCIQVTMGWQGT